MSLFNRIARVKAAQLRMELARHDVARPASALLARGRKYPLTTVGVAAGAGVVLGSLDVHPLRVPGLGPLLSGGFAEVVAQGTRLAAEFAETAIVAHAAAGAVEPGETA
ncbi:hypothetical protein [Rhodanobacter ginsengiterrae]|uniref:hypothetical protein n=1 Tax=Rhodanobacter ginsengiterrae TaxID=2008451 RepID=UPI003CF9C486